eukprot:466235-Alexandrium_andersonii.AAC.1
MLQERKHPEVARLPRPRAASCNWPRKRLLAGHHRMIARLATPNFRTFALQTGAAARRQARPRREP